MTHELNYRLSDDGKALRLWKIRGTVLPGGMWRIEEWKHTNTNTPDACPPDRVTDIPPKPAYALLEPLYNKSVAAQTDLPGGFYVTPRLALYLFLEGFLTPEHFQTARDDPGKWITVRATIREGRPVNDIVIFDPIWDLGAEASLHGAKAMFVPDENGWLS